MADPSGGGGAPPVGGSYADFILQQRELTSRFESIEGRLEAFGAVETVKDITELNKKVRELRENLVKDLDALPESLRRISNDLDAVLLNAKSSLEENFKTLTKVSDGLAKYFEEKREFLEGTIIRPEIIRNKGEQVAAAFEKLKTASGETAEEMAININAAIENLKEVTLQEEFDEIERYSSRIALLERRIEFYRATGQEARRIETEERKKNLESLKEELEIKVSFVEAFARVAEIQKLEEKRLELKTKELALSTSLLEYEKTRAKIGGEINDSMGGYIDKLFRANSQTSTLSKSLMMMFTAEGGITNGVKGLSDLIGNGLAQSFLKPEAAFARLVNFIDENLIKSTFEFNKIMAEVNKQTGGFGEGFEKIALTNDVFKTSAVGSLAAYGISLREAGAAYGTLSKNVVGFNNLLDSERKLLTENAAVMENLGLSAQTFSKLTSQFMGTFRMNAREAKDAIKDLAKDAAALGQDIGKYASDFSATMSKVVGYGREATQIFKELNALAVSTGGALTAVDLTSIADKFATFDSAAESVAKLNMMFGGMSLNIVDLMRKDPAQIIMSIKEAATASHIEFDKLNVGYKRMLAEFFGGDVAKAAAFFNTDLAKAQELINKQIDGEKELEERKKKSADAQRKLTAAIDNMRVAFTPIINIVSTFADGLIAIQEKMGSWPFIVTLIGLIGSAYLAAKNFTLGFVGGLEAVRYQISLLRVEITALNELQAATMLATQAQIQSARSIALLNREAGIMALGSAPVTSPAGGGGGFAGMAGKASMGIMAAAMLIPLLTGMASKKEEVEDDAIPGMPNMNFGTIKSIHASDVLTPYKIGEGPTGSGLLIHKPGGPIEKSSTVVTNMFDTINNSSATTLFNRLAEVPTLLSRAYTYSKEQATNFVEHNMSQIAEFSKKTESSAKDLTKFYVDRQKETIASTATAISTATTNINNTTAKAGSRTEPQEVLVKVAVSPKSELFDAVASTYFSKTGLPIG